MFGVFVFLRSLFCGLLGAVVTTITINTPSPKDVSFVSNVVSLVMIPQWVRVWLA